MRISDWSSDVCSSDLKRGNIACVIVHAKACASRCFNAKMPHERLRTVMPGPDRHALFVQYGADIMRMHPLDLETQYAGAVLRPDGADAVEAGQGLPRLPPPRTFIRVDHPTTGRPPCRERVG